jgi:hypothetical protein
MSKFAFPFILEIERIKDSGLNKKNRDHKIKLLQHRNRLQLKNPPEFIYFDEQAELVRAFFAKSIVQIILILILFSVGMFALIEYYIMMNIQF